MTALLAKLEAASGGSRELGDEILRACGWSLDTKRTLTYPNQWIDPKGGGWDEGTQPDPTQSIDAALTLLKSDHDWIMSKFTDLTQMKSGYTAAIQELTGDGDRDPLHFENVAQSFGATPALALCIAALKAHDRQE